MKLSDFTPLKRDWPVLLLLVAVTLAVYGQIFGQEFLINWDDNLYVTNNETVRGFSLLHVREAFSHFYVGNYAPVQMLSYMLDYTLWGEWAPGFKLTNLLLHASNGYLLYLLFRRLGVQTAASLFASFLFLLHPVQVESVAWVSERKTVLAMFFFLLAILLFDFYREQGGRRWYCTSLVACILALFSKSVTVILPFTLLLLEISRPTEGRPRRWPVELIPFLLAAAVMAVVGVASQAAEYGGGRAAYISGSLLNNLLTMQPVFVRYLTLIFWPLHLSVVYKPPIKTAFDVEVILSALLLAALVGLVLFTFRRHRLFFLGTSLFLLGLVPVSQIIPLSTLMQDRYLYFPMVGVALLAAVAYEAAEAGLAGRKRWLVFCCYGLLLPVGALAWQQTAVWQNSRTLWSDAVAKVPQSKQAWFLFAQTCHDLNDTVCAERAYLEVLARAPSDADALGGLGLLYGEKGELAKSRQYLTRLVDIRPWDGKALFNLGYCCFLSGDDAAAKVFLERALVQNGKKDANTRLVLQQIRDRAGQDGVKR